MTNQENWAIIRKKKIWGVPERRRGRIEKVRTRDYLIFYVTPQSIGGIFKAVSESFQSDETIFRWGEFGRHEVFPYRINIDPVFLPTERIRFTKELANKLEFITYKQKYSIHFRTAMKLISEKDFQVFEGFLRRNLKGSSTIADKIN